LDRDLKAGSRSQDIILCGESLDSLSRELGEEIYRLEKWRDAALGGIDVALKSRNEYPQKAEYDSARKRVGELTMENELLWQRVRRPVELPPLSRTPVYERCQRTAARPPGRRCQVNTIIVHLPSARYQILIIDFLI
jgi:hypothetical protein